MVYGNVRVYAADVIFRIVYFRDPNKYFIAIVRVREFT
jgi:hypothetical protein